MIHDGQVLLGECTDEESNGCPRFTFLGTRFELASSLLECCVQAVDKQAGLAVRPVKLLYVVERFHMEGKLRRHDLAHYFLCEPVEKLEGNLLDALHPEEGSPYKPVLMGAKEIINADLRPSQLRDVLAGDALNNFQVSAKHVVINCLPDDVTAKSGAFRF